MHPTKRIKIYIMVLIQQIFMTRLLRTNLIIKLIERPSSYLVGPLEMKVIGSITQVSFLS